MSDNSNLEQGKEFRKIASLQFLYELDRSGRIVRNVKSKKQLRQFRDDCGQYLIAVDIKGETRRLSVRSLVEECYGVRRCLIRIASKDDEQLFRSKQACAEYLGRRYSQSPEKFRGRLRRRRRHIFDYDIEYLPCAETEHARSTEQETVHR